MSSQGIVSGKETRDNPGLQPVKLLKSILGAQTVPKLILELVFGYYQEYATALNADSLTSD
jgi:hypothetical protein